MVDLASRPDLPPGDTWDQTTPPTPGSRVVIRGEDWIIETVAATTDGWRMLPGDV